jgi:hypothetical protein
MSGPKILLVDIETAPMLAHVWGLWDQTIGLNQIKADWHILSWSAKWLDSPEIFYKDQRKAKDISKDKSLLLPLWRLLNKADIIVTQNGKSFDEKKLNARFIQNGMKPPSSFKHIDTKLIAKKRFAFTSNKLEYLAKALGAKTKKMKSKKFQGFDLWSECLKGNLAAWKEMERYNKADVLALESVYLKLRPWDQSVNFEVYADKGVMTCNCGSTDFHKNGKAYSALGIYSRYRCRKCGAEKRGKANIAKNKAFPVAR